MSTAYIGLGSNLGDRASNLRRALALLSGKDVNVVSVSPLYQTEPVGFTAQPPFLNAVCRGETALAPKQLFTLLKRVERDMGRVATFPGGPRLIDLDLLLYDDSALNEDGLVVPHPRMAERAFVLVPLSDIAPGVRHPLLSKTARQLLAQVSTAGVSPWNGPDWWRGSEAKGISPPSSPC